MRKILLCFLVILTAVIMASCGEKSKITDNDESEVESETLNFKKLTLSTLSGTEENKENDFKYHENENGNIVIDEYVGTSTIMHIPCTIGGKEVEEIGNLPDNSDVQGIYINSNVKNIQNNAFENWTGVQYVYYDTNQEELVSIGDEAFLHCTSLEVFILPNNIKGIGKKAFALCVSLKKVYGVNPSDGIVTDLFEGCTALEEVGFGNKVKEICGNSFDKCKNLKSIYIPNSVTYIESIPKEISIYAQKGSYAEKYAKENGNKCLEIPGVEVIN